MFGGYSDVAAYMLDPEVVGSSKAEEIPPVPPEYLPSYIPPDPWFHKSACTLDFILIAEFSEQEGPKPLITIPRDAGEKFDLNEFSVRIMSVDYQSAASESFGLTEDTQVVVSENQNGIHAYVHHFTLYDSQARGFVRPFCMSYVSPHHDKVMSLYRQLTTEFSRASHLFKYGSRLLFMKDMTHYLSDLQYTRERLQEKEAAVERSKQEESDCAGMDSLQLLFEPEEEVILASVTQTGLDNMIREVKSILDTISTLLIDPEMEEHFNHLEKNGGEEEDVRQMSCSLHEEGPILHYKPHSQRQRAGSFSDVEDSHWAHRDDNVYKPKIVRTSKKRFEKSLRSIHELCQWGAKEGLNKLRNIHMYFSRDFSTLQVEKMESKLTVPSSSLLSIGKTVTLNFLTGLEDTRFSSPQDNSDLILTPSESFTKSFSFDTISSYKSGESFVTCTEESALTEGGESQALLTPACFFSPLSPDHCTDEESTSQRSHNYTSSATGSVSDITGTASEIDWGSSVSDLSLSGVNMLNDYVPNVPAKVLVMSAADHVTNWTAASSGYGILRFVHQHSFSPHLLYSLLCGRPVMLVGGPKHEHMIKAAVNTLSIFIPGYSSHNSGAVVPWQCQPVRLCDLGTQKLVGLCRRDRRPLSWLLPTVVRKYVTVLDLEKKILEAPTYKGGTLTDIYNKRKAISNEPAYMMYIHSVLYELAMKSYLYYHSLCMAPNMDHLDYTTSLECRLHWEKRCNEFFNKIKLNLNDVPIVKYFVEIVKTQQVKEYQQRIYNNKDLPVPNIHLDSSPCSTFKS